MQFEGLGRFSSDSARLESYTVRDMAQLEDILTRLRRGEDPLAQTRRQIIRELFPAGPEQTIRDILEEMV